MIYAMLLASGMEKVWFFSKQIYFPTLLKWKLELKFKVHYKIVSFKFYDFFKFWPSCCFDQELFQQLQYQTKSSRRGSKKLGDEFFE